MIVNMIKTWHFLHGIQRHQHTRETRNKRRFLIRMQHLFLNYLASLPPTLPPTLLCADNERLPFSDAVFLTSIWNCSLWVLYRLPFCSQPSRGVSTSACPNGASPVFPSQTHHISSAFNFVFVFFNEISLKPSTSIRKWISSLRLWRCAAEKLPRSPMADALAI